MKNATLKDLQQKELFILDSIIDILNEKNLSWFVSAGTLLGAVRHGGMIPWDDDIDIAMPREDYNKLQENYKEWIQEPLFMQTPLTDDFYFSGCMKIRLDNTTFMAKDDYQARYHHGIFIDIFPIDSVPDKHDDQLCFFEHLRAYNKLFDSLYKCGKRGSNPLYSEFCPKLYEGLNATFTLYSKLNSNSKFVARPGFWYYELEFFKKNLIDKNNFELRSNYDSYIEMEFTGLRNKVRVPVGYDRILSIAYGDNWRTPKNSGGHGKVVADVETGFEYYDNLPEEEFEGLLKEISSEGEESNSKNNKKDVVPIVFSMDENYVPYCSTVIASIIDHVDKNRDYNIYIFHNGDLTQESMSTLSKMSTDNIKVIPFDIHEYLEGIKFSNVSWFTVEMYYRILIPQILYMYDKVIYIDCDTICGDDIAKLYDLVEFNGEYIAACSDNKMGNGMKEYITDKLKLDPETYVNSGMLVLNSKLIREINLFGNLKEFLEEYGWLRFPDQDLLNIYCKGKIKYLDHYWNFQHPRIMTDEDKIRYASSCPGVVHFTAGECKPWNNTSINLSEWFWHYAEKSPFYNLIMERYQDVLMKNDLNNYFKNPGKFKDKIIVISSKGNVSNNCEIFNKKNKLGITVTGKTYIAVIDNLRDFKKELSSDTITDYIYKTDEGSVWALSGNTNGKYVSAVKVGPKTITFRKNGLNIVIVNAKTFEVVDSFSVKYMQ